MINFCHPVMNPVVDCGTVCTDGYEITNLVSKDPDLRRKGFIAYHAIRPPVTVELSFTCKVNVSEVILWSEVGSQKSTGFELYAACICNSSAPCSCRKICSSSYEKIGCAFINGCEKGVTFRRNNNVSSHADTSNLVKSMLFGSKRAYLNNVTNLLIKIIKTASLPCLARVEVWGQPSGSTNEATRKHLTSLWEQNVAEVTTNKITNICRDDNESNSLNKIEDDSFKVPEEFLDPITFRLMALPMTLPCGKIVDQSTLDKHQQYEASWGRAPSDPFTGKVFTNSCHPVLATSLKARIDKFLIEHADVPELKSVPRTVGVKIPHGAATSLFVYQNTSSAANVEREKNVQETKRAHDVVSEYCNANKKQRVGQSLLLNHEERLNRSLRSAVKNVLAGLPSFTKFEDVEVKSEECTQCCSKLVLYKLPCTHFVCRSCLVQKQSSTSRKCCACNAKFQSDDPVRHYM